MHCVNISKHLLTMSFQALPQELRRHIFDNLKTCRQRACWRMINKETSQDHANIDVAKAGLLRIWKPFRELYFNPNYCVVQISFGTDDYAVWVLRLYDTLGSAPSYNVQAKGKLTTFSSANRAWASCGNLQL